MFFRIPVGMGKEDDGTGRDELGGGGDDRGSCWEGGMGERVNTGELQGSDERGSGEFLMRCAGVGGCREQASKATAVSSVACPSVSEGRYDAVGKTSDSSCCWIPFPEAMVLVTSGATGLPLFDGDQSVGVPCPCKEVGEGVRCGNEGHTGTLRSQDSDSRESKRDSTGE